MKPLLLAPAVLALLVLTACSGGDEPTTASDPAGVPVDAAAPDESDAPDAAAPTAPDIIPAALGRVRSTGLPTVMDTGGGAELCLGGVAESYPPQCGGPVISNWDWSEHRGTFDREGDVRWGTYAITGAWDGTEVTVSDAITGALYDPIMPEPVELPEPSTTYTDAELQQIVESIGDDLPGYLGSSADEAGHVLVDVVYDDGTLQAYVDETYGAGVVVLTTALADVEA